MYEPLTELKVVATSSAVSFCYLNSDEDANVNDFLDDTAIDSPNF